MHSSKFVILHKAKNYYVSQYPLIGFIQWEVKKNKPSAIEHPIFWFDEMVELSWIRCFRHTIE